MFKEVFWFEGRIRRLEYGLSLIIYYVALVVVVQLIDHLPITEDTKPLIFALPLLPGVWFRLAQGAKRCHDLDQSGWYQLIPFYTIFLIFSKGQAGPNRYGDDPKDINRDLTRSQ